MFADLLGISDEELGRMLAHQLYGGRDIPVDLYDVLAMSMMAWRELIKLRGRFNQYDAQGAGDLLTIKETMRLTGLSRSSVYRKLKDSSFTSTKSDGRRLIYRGSVERWLHTEDQYRVGKLWDPRPEVISGATEHQDDQSQTTA